MPSKDLPADAGAAIKLSKGSNEVTVDLSTA